MPHFNLAFEKRFVWLVQTGKVRHTIHPAALRKPRIHPGDRLSLCWFPTIHKSPTLIGETVCISAREFSIDKFGTIVIDGKRLFGNQTKELAFDVGFFTEAALRCSFDLEDRGNPFQLLGWKFPFTVE